MRWVWIIAVLFGMSIPHSMAGEGTVLKAATTAPDTSTWGKTLAAWEKQFKEKTGGSAALEIHYNSSEGTEYMLVDKLLSGQLDVVAVTAVGLERIDKNLGIFHLPGVIQSWKTLDAARAGVGPALEKLLEAKNVKLLSWADVGCVRVMAKGYALGCPADLKGQKPWVQTGDPVAEKLFAEIEGRPPAASDRLLVPGDLKAGKINCMLVPTQSADALQWMPHLDNGLEMVAGVQVGAVVISAPAFAKLTEDQQQALQATSTLMVPGLQTQTRKADTAAWGKFRNRVDALIHKPNSKELAEWMAVFKAVRDKLKANYDETILKRFEESVGAKL